MEGNPYSGQNFMLYEESYIISVKRYGQLYKYSPVGRLSMCSLNSKRVRKNVIGNFVRVSSGKDMCGYISPSSLRI